MQMQMIRSPLAILLCALAFSVLLTGSAPVPADTIIPEASDVPNNLVETSGVAKTDDAPFEETTMRSGSYADQGCHDSLMWRAKDGAIAYI